jgi:2-keto-4-pentenoate hydratase/2-oxohepta-3-ene-1,7-dioic acid hydratase in catechol pathway
MRLARHGAVGAEAPIASIMEGVWHDLRPVTADITAAFLGTHLRDLDVAALPVVEHVDRFGAPLADVGKIVCVGVNYLRHAAEAGTDAPSEPILFLKASDTVIGADVEVLIPRGATKTDWEVELALVIGRTARYLDSPEQAQDHIAGYTISNDVSERTFQLERGGQWDKGKNCETFNPIGPWLATVDEVPDPQNLGLRLWVNGQLRQDSNTANMIFGVNHLVWYISQFMVLRPGDVINTGTPHGVALGSPDQCYLKAGDVMELEIDGLGRQRQLLRQSR